MKTKWQFRCWACISWIFCAKADNLACDVKDCKINEFLNNLFVTNRVIESQCTFDAISLLNIHIFSWIAFREGCLSFSLFFLFFYLPSLFDWPIERLNILIEHSQELQVLCDWCAVIEQIAFSIWYLLALNDDAVDRLEDWTCVPMTFLKVTKVHWVHLWGYKQLE